jgi:hypothetical protein
MMDFDGKTYFAENTNFYIDGESEKYKLHFDGIYASNLCKNLSYFQL